MKTYDKRLRFTFCISLCALLLATIVSLVVVSRVRAATNMSATDLAAACNANSSITLSSNTVVTGGTGTIQQTCYVHLASGVSLTMTGLILTSPISSGFGFVVDGGDKTQVHVSQSGFFMSGGLFLGQNAGENGALTGNQQTTSVSQSLLMAGLGPSNQGDLVVGASGCNTGGNVTVNNSTLQSPSEVSIAAGQSDPPDPQGSGCNGNNGTIQVTHSNIASVSSASTGFVAIWTGRGGQTIVQQSIFFTNGPASLFAGVRCTAQGNTPNLPCNL